MPHWLLFNQYLPRLIEALTVDVLFASALGVQATLLGS